MEVPQTSGGGSPNVIFETLKLVASRFALGEDMVTSCKVLRAVALLGKMKEPRGLLRFVVALKLSGEEGLVGDFPDSGPASADRILFIALMAEVREFQDSQFDSSPEGLPKPVQVASQNSTLKVRGDAPDASVDVLALQANELRMFVFIGLLEKAVVRSESMLQVSSRRIVVGVRSGPRVGKKIISMGTLWGFPVEVQESLLNQPIQRGYEPLLVHGISGRVKGEVNLDCAVGGAQVASPDIQPSNQAECTCITEHVIASCCSIGLLGYARWL